MRLKTLCRLYVHDVGIVLRSAALDANILHVRHDHKFNSPVNLYARRITEEPLNDAVIQANCTTHPFKLSWGGRPLTASSKKSTQVHLLHVTGAI